MAAATAWYQKAAEQNNDAAIQRLQLIAKPASTKS
jgi:TPR repeat protein